MPKMKFVSEDNFLIGTLTSHHANVDNKMQGFASVTNARMHILPLLLKLPYFTNSFYSKKPKGKIILISYIHIIKILE